MRPDDDTRSPDPAPAGDIDLGLPPDFDALSSWRPNPAAVSSEAADAAASAIAAALPPAPPLTDGSAPASTPASPASPAAPE